MRLKVGTRVAFAGDPYSGGPAVGDVGRVVASDASSAHVAWSEEAAIPRGLTLEATYTLTPVADDGTEALGFDVTSTIQREGALGVVVALDERGHLTALRHLAAEFVRKLRLAVDTSDPITAAAAQMDAEAASEVAEGITAMLLAEAAGIDLGAEVSP